MKRLFISMILVLVAGLAFGAPTARIMGTVTDAETDETIIGANVVLVGMSRGSATDLDGHFLILALEKGLYTVQVSAIGYETYTLEGVQLDAGQRLTLDIELTGSAVKLETVTVTGQSETGSEERELEERLEDVTITDAISAETISRLPDPDVANVVRRATGVSTLGGDPVIRGLGARYSKVTLNSAQVSGTEPNRSAVSLNLFPASVMSQVNVSKSYTPDQWGEFGGGAVNMNTWDIPAGNLSISASTSTSYRVGTTGKKFYSYAGGAWDWLAWDDGAREMPSDVASGGQLALGGQFSERGYSEDDMIRLGRLFPNNWGTYSYNAPVNQGYNLSISDRLELAGRDLDLLASLLYDRSSTAIEKDLIVLKGGVGEAADTMHNYTFNEYMQNVSAGGLINLRYQFSPLHRFAINTLYNRDMEDETRFYEGVNRDRGADIRDIRLRYVQQVTWTSQFSGSHAIPNLLSSVLDWHMTYSRGERYEPDTREVQFESEPLGLEDPVFIWADEEQSGSRFYNDLYDDTYSGGVDWELHPIVGVTRNEVDLQIKSGVAFVERKRESDTRFFEYKRDAGFNTLFMQQDPMLLFAPNNVSPDIFLVEETTRPTDNYKADMSIQAAYVLFKGRVLPKLRGSFGARVEHAKQNVNTFALFNPDEEPAVADLENTDVMPALTLIYEPMDRTNFRLAASRTVSRPDFRELSPFEFTDILGGRAVQGNPDLQRALIDNYDLRFEKVYGVSNLFAVSAFYKRFHQPIETVIRITAQISESFENADGATSYGLEMEWRQNLGMLTDLLEPFSLSTNLSLLHSEIELSDEAKLATTSDSRPLEGQSPFLFNVNLSYMHPSWGTNADLFLNGFGKRIVAVGYEPMADEYELPHWELDFTMRQPLTRHLSLKFAAKNLLDPDYQREQGDIIVERYSMGRSFSIGASWMQ